MNKKQREEADRKRQLLLQFAAELHEEDGIDPQFTRSGHGRNIKPRKLLALCKQVQQAIEMSIPANLEVEVLDVVPDADPGKLVVVWKAPPRLTNRLEELKPMFRSEVARTITRKRTPDLIFRFSSEA